MPIREATFIPRIANHSKVHQTWFSRQPNRILPNTELWRKARGTKMGNAIPLRVVVSSLAREITRQRKREMRRTAMEDEPIAGSHTHTRSSLPLSLALWRCRFLRTKSYRCCFLRTKSGEKKRPVGPDAFLQEIYTCFGRIRIGSAWPLRIVTGNIYYIHVLGGSDPRHLGGLRQGPFI